jgi:hypothetical protein
MGEKKKKEVETARWKKVLVVGACVLFVVLMVVSGMGSGWLSMFNSVKPGESAVIDYTIYNSAGDPIVTTDSALYKQVASTGKGILAAKQISVPANTTLKESIYPLQVYTSQNGWDTAFALHAPEYDAISAALVGMKVNQQKKVSLPTTTSMAQLWTKEDLALRNLSIDDFTVGDLVTMGERQTPDGVSVNTSVITYMRIGEVTRKTAAGVVVDPGYPTADIRVVSISGRN